MNKFDEESYEAHDAKANSCGNSYFLKFCNNINPMIFLPSVDLYNAFNCTSKKIHTNTYAIVLQIYWCV